jgi:hypothetical protein
VPLSWHAWFASLDVGAAAFSGVFQRPGDYPLRTRRRQRETGEVCNCAGGGGGIRCRRKLSGVVVIAAVGHDGGVIGRVRGFPSIPAVRYAGCLDHPAQIPPPRCRPTPTVEREWRRGRGSGVGCSAGGRPGRLQGDPPLRDSQYDSRLACRRDWVLCRPFYGFAFSVAFLDMSQSEWFDSIWVTDVRCAREGSHEDPMRILSGDSRRCTLHS